VGVALSFGLTLDANSSSERFAWRVPGKSRWRRGVVAGLVAALVSGIAMGVVFWLAFRPAVGLIAGVLLGVAMGCVTGLQFGMDTNAEERLILGQDANRLIRDDLTAALMVGLMFFVIAGLTFFGFGAALAHRPGVFLMLTVRLTLILGLIGALVTGSMHAVAAGRYAVASVIFRVSGRFPSRSAQFLDWARTVGLLRVTGISYQFRHDSYGEWLIASGGNETGIIKSDSRVEVDSG
jgi:multisubunit Na+/H+ antiporter MnhB subunit